MDIDTVPGALTSAATPHWPDDLSVLSRYRPLVRRLAGQMKTGLPAGVDIDDLIQVGMLGLADALSRYDAEQGAKFETFAIPRIRGAMIDELRRADWLSRQDRRRQREMRVLVQSLEHRLGRRPADGEVAYELGLTLPEYFERLTRQRQGQLVDLGSGSDDSSDADGDDDSVCALDRMSDRDQPDFVERIARQRMASALVESIQQLPEREQQVMAMIYDQEMFLKEIAAVLGVSESRVCQIHNAAIARLRSALKGD